MKWTRASVGVAVLCLALVLELPTSAFGTLPGPHHGFIARAKMYADPITGLEGHAHVQVYRKLCKGANLTRLCVATNARLRAALTRLARGSGTQITWVDTPVQDGTDFWVLSPIRFPTQRDARFLYHFEEASSGPHCVGHGSSRFHWSNGAWHLAGGGSVEGCP